ncbi:unnamed protein product [Cuscuta campestris]|uniref:Uncharacterized protein n=1 Tax=Cuscuta campestris TaxID=132261 RepID=A0A484N664_9ASTE|nr:unnamed protein product [Cuscuta campestris]
MILRRYLYYAFYTRESAAVQFLVLSLYGVSAAGVPAARIPAAGVLANQQSIRSVILFQFLVGGVRTPTQQQSRWQCSAVATSEWPEYGEVEPYSHIQNGNENNEAHENSIDDPNIDNGMEYG